MKVLFKNRSFGGGAPKSLLSYIKLVKDRHHHVLSVGQFNYEPKEYKEAGVDVTHMDYFILSKPLLNFKLLKEYLAIIEQEKPDIIHATTIYNVYFQYIVEKLTGIPSIYMIPGGKISSFTGRMMASLLKDKPVIVYSKENQEDLIREGVKKNNIIHISNRVDFSEIREIQDPNITYNQKKTKKVQALMISRFSETKIKSIRHTIQLIYELIEEGLDIELTILGDGLLYDEMVEEANELNQKLGRNVFNLLGYKNNVQDYVKEAHIIFGKGRSILDGIIQKRYAAVVTEEPKIFMCRAENFKLISDYNITGRNKEELTPISKNELKKMFEQIEYNQVQTEKIEELYQVAKEIYDVNERVEEILGLYESLPIKSDLNYTPSLFQIAKEFIKLYSTAIYQSLKKS